MPDTIKQLISVKIRMVIAGIMPLNTAVDEIYELMDDVQMEGK